MHAPIFHGAVTKDGRLTLLSTEHSQRRRWLKTLAGDAVEVIVRKVQSQRSLEQNALIHVIASALADHCGNSLGEMKLLLMGEMWGWQTVQGHEMPVKPHTSDMSVEEASRFIDWLFPWMAEHFPELDIDRQRFEAA